MTFWTKASTEERLAQIDGGIECGMTSKQIAMCLRAPIYDDADAVKAFGHRHGRRFTTPVSVSTSRAGKRGGKVSGLMTARRNGTPEPNINGAFSIFSTPPEQNPFASLTEEELT